MSESSGAGEEREVSLAEQAAAWVPPWERRAEPPPLATDPDPAPDPADLVDDPTEAEPPAESPLAMDESADKTGLVADPSMIDAGAGPTDAEPPAAESDAPRAERAEAAPVERPTDSLIMDESVGGDAFGADSSMINAVAGAAGVEPALGGGAATGDSAAEETGGAPSPVPDERAEPAAAFALIDEGELRGALEAIMLVVDEPVQEIVLAQVLEQPTERVAAALEEIAAGYTQAGHGFELRRAAGGWRLYTRPAYASYVERFVLDGQSVRLTQAALETLAVVAYKQPVTRSRISAIRGVNCDGVIRTLTSRGLVEECGTEPETGAYLYRTTTLFLEKLGLDSVDQLPDLAPFLPDDIDEVFDGER